jgi:2-phosphosulfolactate phosphatase
MTRSFYIDCFALNRQPSAAPYAVVAIDVLRATTTATTALHLGHAVYPALNSEQALAFAPSLNNALLVGEVEGVMPPGFDLTNSPVKLAALSALHTGEITDVHRPIVLVSSSGMPLLMNSIQNCVTYIACLRNVSAVSEYIANNHNRIALIGAGTGGEFRREDQVGCAWIGRRLMELGYRPENDDTKRVVEKWFDCDADVIREGNSAQYLQRTGQADDLEFTLKHIDDLRLVPKYSCNQLEAVV